MSRYLLKIAGQISGPHSLAALQEMASVRAFDETALLALENTHDWKAVRDIPSLPALLFPPRKTLSFKATTFESLPQEATGPVTVHEILHANLEAEAKNGPLRPLVKYPNRRRRDFLVCIILCDLVGGALYRYLPHSHDTTTILVTIFAILNVGLYGLFYQIMDRY